MPCPHKSPHSPEGLLIHTCPVDTYGIGTELGRWGDQAERFCVAFSSGFPAVWDQFLEPLGGLGADALEDLPKVGKGIHTEPFPYGNEACASGRWFLLEMTSNDKPFQPPRRLILER